MMPLQSAIKQTSKFTVKFDEKWSIWFGKYYMKALSEDGTFDIDIYMDEKLEHWSLK
jgi:hypothetical protein